MTDSVCTEFFKDESIEFSNKMPIESSKAKLLYHYRGKVSHHLIEREEWIAQLESVGHSQEYLYSLMQKLIDANNDIYKIQAKLSTVQDSIFSEKHQALKLLQENKELKLQQLTDQKRLKEFISLTAPKQASVTFFQDKRPSSAKEIRKSSSECTWCALCKRYSGPKHHHLVGKVTNQPKTMVRTVYLPNEELNTLMVEVDMIKDQIEQEKETFENELQALKEEQSVRLQEKQMRKLVDENKIKELSTLVEAEEEGKNIENKTYLRLRYEVQESEKELKRIIELMEKGLDQARDKYVESKNLAKVETKEEERQADKKSNEFSYKFRKQVIKHEENIQVIKEQYADLQAKYAEKVDQLEQNIANLTQNYKDLEEKRRIAKNKLNRQVDNLQDRLRELENDNREKKGLKNMKDKRNDDSR